MLLGLGCSCHAGLISSPLFQPCQLLPFFYQLLEFLTAAPPHCASLALHLTQRCYNQNRPPQTICRIGEGFFFCLYKYRPTYLSHTETRHTLHLGLLAGARVARSVPARERIDRATCRLVTGLVPGERGSSSGLGLVIGYQL